MRATYYTRRGGVHVEHVLAFKVFGRYLVITWVWTA